MYFFQYDKIVGRMIRVNVVTSPKEIPSKYHTKKVNAEGKYCHKILLSRFTKVFYYLHFKLRDINQNNFAECMVVHV